MANHKTTVCVLMYSVIINIYVVPVVYFLFQVFYFSFPSKKCYAYPDFLFYLLNLFNFFLYLLTLVIIVVGSLARISVAMENNS